MVRSMYELFGSDWKVVNIVRSSDPDAPIGGYRCFRCGHVLKKAYIVRGRDGSTAPVGSECVTMTLQGKMNVWTYEKKAAATVSTVTFTSAAL